MFLLTSLMLMGCENKGLILVEEQEVEPAEERLGTQCKVQPSVEPTAEPSIDSTATDSTIDTSPGSNIPVSPDDDSDGDGGPIVKKGIMVPVTT